MSLLQSCSFCFAHIYWWWFHLTKQCTVLSPVIWALIIIKREHREVVRVQEGRRGKQWSWKTNVIVYKVIVRLFQGSVLSSSTLKSAHSEQKILIWMVTFHRMAATLMSTLHSWNWGTQCSVLRLHNNGRAVFYYKTALLPICFVCRSLEWIVLLLVDWDGPYVKYQWCNI